MLAASALACQVAIGVGDYDFGPTLVETQPSSSTDDAGAAVGAGPGSSSNAGADASAAAVDADADGGVRQPDAGTSPPCRGLECLADSCEGCLVGARCVPPGQALPSNPCLVCDPALSASGYSIAFDKPCGAEANACSEHDRCDAEGFCAPNDLPEGTRCGDATGAACDVDDSCDGAGACVDRRADDSTPCEDGLFCTTGDQCHAGACASGGPLPCAENEQCVEAADACECTGCVVDGVCLAAGARNGSACFVCAPQRSRSALSPDPGSVCGEPDGECFDARTCDANGDCVSRPLGAGTACGSSFSTDCSGADSCDGNGFCNPNDATDGSVCEDGLFCTEGDSCVRGACTSGGALSCGSGRQCDELDGCTCGGGLMECLDGTCRRFCSGGEIP